MYESMFNASYNFSSALFTMIYGTRCLYHNHGSCICLHKYDDLMNMGSNLQIEVLYNWISVHFVTMLL